MANNGPFKTRLWLGLALQMRHRAGECLKTLLVTAANMVEVVKAAKGLINGAEVILLKGDIPGQPDVVNLLLDGIQGLKLFREWLEQQTVTGVLTVENPQAEATARRFQLSPAHAEVLAKRDSLNYLAPLAQLVVGATSPIKSVLEVFQNPRQKANHKGTKRRSNYSARD
jgi:hypothetical protein